jgi:hypothetical protein
MDEVLLLETSLRIAGVTGFALGALRILPLMCKQAAVRGRWAVNIYPSVP